MYDPLMNQPGANTPDSTANDGIVQTSTESGWRDLWTRDDWVAIWLGAFVLAAISHFVWHAQPADFEQQLAQIRQRKQALAEYPAANSQVAEEDLKKYEAEAKKEIKQAEKKLLTALTSPFKDRVVKPQSWSQNPIDAVYQEKKHNLLAGLLLVGASLWLLFTIAAVVRGESAAKFTPGFWGLFLLAILAYLLANQEVIKFYNLEYPLWGLLVGLSISNILGTPAWLRPAVQTELYIKTGLVLLGCEVLFSQLLQLGLPGIFISWVTTPIVLIGTFLFGQYVLKIPSRTLNIVIAADMSVCGVSAAIATAAACRAKKSELSLAIGLSLGFTVIMMIVMPICIQAMGMDPVLGGAWIGGTIDATGAVAAAGESLGPKGLFVATTVKMIQNILIGVIAFGVAVYWASVVERGSATRTIGLSEIWRRFPKFVLGFVLVSAVFSYLYRGVPGGTFLVDAVKDVEKTIREWLFCLAFVSIGLESNLQEFREQLRDGKALTLYILGQAFNLVMTLFMAWLMFYVVFPDIVKKL